MDVLGDVVGRNRRSEALALQGDSRTESYSYGTLCTDSWKTANLLRHYGVRAGAPVGVGVAESGPTPQVAAGIFGAALLGAPVHVASGARVAAADSALGDAAALLVPAGHVDDDDVPPGCTVLAYGDVPDDPAVVHYERERWSENPVTPPETVAPDATALLAEEAYTHADVLSWCDDVVETHGLDRETTVAAGLWDTPASLVETLLAPLVAGATVSLAEGDES